MTRGHQYCSAGASGVAGPLRHGSECYQELRHQLRYIRAVRHVKKFQQVSLCGGAL